MYAMDSMENPLHSAQEGFMIPGFQRVISQKRCDSRGIGGQLFLEVIYCAGKSVDRTAVFKVPVLGFRIDPLPLQNSLQAQDSLNGLAQQIYKPATPQFGTSLFAHSLALA